MEGGEIHPIEREMRGNYSATEIILPRNPHGRNIMSIPAITLETVTVLIRTLPLLVPRPTGASIRALKQDLITRLGSMPFHQLREHGYIGIVMQPILCARNVRYLRETFASSAEGTQWSQSRGEVARDK